MDASLISNLIWTGVGIVVGGAITFLAADMYYKRAGEELRNEATELRRLITIVLTAMESHGLATLRRDSAGNIIGYSHVAQPGSGSVSFSGSLGTEHRVGGGNKSP